MITTLSQLIRQVESNGNSSAQRYEPGWRYITPALISICKRSHPYSMSDDTARALMMFSYGQYQIMGSVLYERGYKGQLCDFLQSTTLQDAWFPIDVKARKIDFSLDEVIQDSDKRNLFALKYNGNVRKYSQRMLDIYHAGK